MRVAAREVIAATVMHFGLPKEAMTNSARYRSVARPRQIAMYLIREMCPHMSYPGIGRLMGGRDHTTVLHGVRKITELLKSDPDLIVDVDDIRIAAKAMHPLRNPVIWEAYGEAMRQAA